MAGCTSSCTPIVFEAEPGKVYRVAFTPEPRIFEVDRHGIEMRRLSSTAPLGVYV